MFSTYIFYILFNQLWHTRIAYGVSLGLIFQLPKNHTDLLGNEKVMALLNNPWIFVGLVVRRC